MAQLDDFGVDGERAHEVAAEYGERRADRDHDRHSDLHRRERTPPRGEVVALAEPLADDGRGRHADRHRRHERQVHEIDRGRVRGELHGAETADDEADEHGPRRDVEQARQSGRPADVEEVAELARVEPPGRARCEFAVHVVAHKQHVQHGGLEQHRDDRCPCRSADAHGGQSELAEDEDVIEDDVRQIADDGRVHGDDRPADGLEERGERGLPCDERVPREPDAKIDQFEFGHLAAVVHGLEEGTRHRKQQQRERAGGKRDVDSLPRVARTIGEVAPAQALRDERAHATDDADEEDAERVRPDARGTDGGEVGGVHVDAAEPADEDLVDEVHQHEGERAEHDGPGHRDNFAQSFPARFRSGYVLGLVAHNSPVQGVAEATYCTTVKVPMRTDLVRLAK